MHSCLLRLCFLDSDRKPLDSNNWTDEHHSNDTCFGETKGERERSFNT